MTREEFLDKERDFARGIDTDVVRFYHTTIMKIFDDIEKEKTMGEIYVVSFTQKYIHYNFYDNEEQAKNDYEIFKKADPNGCVKLEKWSMMQFANWVSNRLDSIDYRKTSYIG